MATRTSARLIMLRSGDAAARTTRSWPSGTGQRAAGPASVVAKLLVRWQSREAASGTRTIVSMSWSGTGSTTRSTATRKSSATRQWYAEHREESIEHSRQWHAERTAEFGSKVFGHYGTVCACCGTRKNLSIDHIAGGGAEHRIELFGTSKGGWMFYRWLVEQGFPDGYQTLCMPCNSSKGSGERCRRLH